MLVQFVQKSSSYFSLSMIHFVHAMSSAASVPGRIGSHTSALAASIVMRGSMTTVFKPCSRARSSATARGNRAVGRVGAPQHEGVHRRVGEVVVPTIGVAEGQVVRLAHAVRQLRGAHAWQVALRAARLPHVGRVDGLAEALHVAEVRVAATAGGHGHAFRAVLLVDLDELRGDLGDGLVPGDALPLVLAALAHAAHGVLVAVGMVQRLDAGHALRAQAALAHRAFGIALDLDDATVLHMRQHGAACDAGAAGRLHDLHVAARIGMRRIDVHEVVAHGNAQTACGAQRRRRLHETASRDGRLCHVPSFFSSSLSCLLAISDGSARCAGGDRAALYPTRASICRPASVAFHEPSHVRPPTVSSLEMK